MNQQHAHLQVCLWSRSASVCVCGWVRCVCTHEHTRANPPALLLTPSFLGTQLKETRVGVPPGREQVALFPRELIKAQGRQASARTRRVPRQRRHALGPGPGHMAGLSAHPGVFYVVMMVLRSRECLWGSPRYWGVPGAAST